MKILLLHSEDDPEKGPWAGLAWDRVVDLGLGGVDSYARWTRQFQCPVTTVKSLRNGFKDFRRIRDLLAIGCDRLVDAYGLDWWEIMSILLHGELETLILLQSFAETVGASDEVHVSRPGIHASILQSLLGARVSIFPLRRGGQRHGLRHYIRVFNKLSATEVADVFWDKYDLGYQVRGRLTRKRAPSERPVILLPTAYINVSRTGIAYAGTFPKEDFLLVTTRRSGWIQDRPPNVEAAWLRSYASVSDRSSEQAALESRWRFLLDELAGVVEFEILKRLGRLDGLSRRFRQGLEVRDAWRNVLDTEPIQAVLCADDCNPYTRIPLLLAQARGIPNIACHHGALNGRSVFKSRYADVIWAKGKMEEDYLLRKCGVPLEKIEIAAPALPTSWKGLKQPNRRTLPYILFLSEVFEEGGGRPEEVYRDVLPPLANLAMATGRKLVVKLHPAESERQRGGILARTLSPEQKAVTQIVNTPLTEDLLAQAWFGITILSTAAMECAIRGIPCFLCTWLEAWPYEYVEQFIRFGIGIGLNGPSEIGKIPDYLQQHQLGADVRENCWQPAAAGRMREFLTTSRHAYTTEIR
jgi:hypothetical protein